MPRTPSQDLLSPQLLAQLERLELVTRKVFRGRMKGERRSQRKGQSVEFADFRNYVPGDDLRFIDWNLYARLDRLFLKLFLEEEDLHFYALVDCSRSMDFGEPSKLTFAKQLAASLGYIGLCRADRVKVESLASGLRSAAPSLRGKSSLRRLIDHVDQFSPGEDQGLLEGVRQFCLRNPGQGILVLITDLMDKSGYESALRLLVSQRIDVYVIHVLSQEEINPEVQGDLRLVDSEDQDQAEVTISRPLLQKYERTLRAFVGSARDFCAKRGITYLQTTSHQPIDQLVAHYLLSLIHIY